MKTMTRISMGAVVALLALAFATPAEAQVGFGVSFGGHGRHKSKHVIAHCGTPAPRPHFHTAGCRKWVPPHKETVCERVFVPGCTRRVWIAPQYRTDYTPCGNPVQVLVTPGHYETIQDPGHYDTVEREVCVPGRWVTTCGF